MSRAAEQMAIPPVWRSLVNEINGGRIPDGEPGIRDVDAPCEVFDPVGTAFQTAPGTGDCETDGHYICAECVHISRDALRRKRDECIECGADMVDSKALGQTCSAQCEPRLPDVFG